VTIEDASLDSFQNVLFSIARFRELTGAYPTRTTVVGHDFKRRRFERLHRLALRWPKLRFTYEGVLLANEADEREVATGELFNAYTPYSGNLYGCHAPLVKKRAERNFHMCEPMAIMLARQKWASCWSGAQGWEGGIRWVTSMGKGVDSLE